MKCRPAASTRNGSVSASTITGTDWRPRQTLGSFRSCGKPVVLSAHECPQLSVVDCHAGLARPEPACCRDDACPHPGPVCTGCQPTSPFPQIGKAPGRERECTHGK